MIMLVLLVCVLGCAPVETVKVCNAIGCGVGFINQSGGVTTAAHVVDIDDRLRVSNGWYRRSAKVLEVDRFNDTALLDGFYSNDVKYCDAQAGDDVTIYVRISNTVEREYHGVVLLDLDGLYLLTEYHADYGHSGSPVVRDDGDCVIGIVVARMLDKKITKVSKVE